MAARQEVRLKGQKAAETKRTGSRYTFAVPTGSIIGISAAKVQSDSAEFGEKWACFMAI